MLLAWWRASGGGLASVASDLTHTIIISYNSELSIAPPPIFAAKPTQPSATTNTPNSSCKLPKTVILKPRRGIARRSYILDNPDAAAEAIFNAAIRPPGRSSLGRPLPAELATPPPPLSLKKSPLRRSVLKRSTNAESLLVTP